jgi:hypothetical protein
MLSTRCSERYLTVGCFNAVKHALRCPIMYSPSPDENRLLTPARTHLGSCTRFGKLRENSNKLVKENKKNLHYGPGIAGPFKEDRGTGDEGKSTTAVSRAVEGGKVEFKCPYCFVWGHQRKSSKLCLKNTGRTNSEPTCAPIIATTDT